MITVIWAIQPWVGFPYCIPLIMTIPAQRSFDILLPAELFFPIIHNDLKISYVMMEAFLEIIANSVAWSNTRHFSATVLGDKGLNWV